MYVPESVTDREEISPDTLWERYDKNEMLELAEDLQKFNSLRTTLFSLQV